jgi:hypothetical protein
VYKKKGKEPLTVSSYRGITLCSTVAKLYERVLLNRITVTSIVDLLNMPDSLQTAYCKGLACSDAIFFTQEAILSYLHDGAHPLLVMHF